MTESPFAARVYREAVDVLRGGDRPRDRLASAGQWLTQLGQLDLMSSGLWREHVGLLSGWRDWVRLSPSKKAELVNRIAGFASRLEPASQTTADRRTK